MSRRTIRCDSQSTHSESKTKETGAANREPSKNVPDVGLAVLGICNTAGLGADGMWLSGNRQATP
jgi:hypothetical protein